MTAPKAFRLRDRCVTVGVAVSALSIQYLKYVHFKREANIEQRALLEEAIRANARRAMALVVNRGESP